MFASAARQSLYEARLEACFWKIFNDRKADFSGESDAPTEAITSTPPTELRTSQLPVARKHNIFHTTPYTVVAGKTYALN